MFYICLKIFLFILLCLGWFTGGADRSVIVPLGALALSLLLQLLLQRLPAVFRFAGAAAVALLSVYRMPFSYFLPLFAFDLWPPELHPKDKDIVTEPGHGERWAGLLLLIPLFLYGNVWTWVFCLLAVILAYSAREIEWLRDERHRLRDDFEERFLNMEDRLRTMKQEDEKNRHLARLDERNRISRSLHDVTGHTLSSALLQVGALEVINKDPALTEPLAKLHETLDWGMTGIRNALHDLYSDAFDLETELRQTLSRAERFDTKLFCADTTELPLQMKLDLLSIAREAVTNAIKYSNGDRLEIRLSIQSDIIGLNVHDNGRCAPEESGSLPEEAFGGIGLRGIRELTERYRGHLNINRSPEDGFTLHVVFFREKPSAVSERKASDENYHH